MNKTHNRRQPRRAGRKAQKNRPTIDRQTVTLESGDVVPNVEFRKVGDPSLQQQGEIVYTLNDPSPEEMSEALERNVVMVRDRAINALLDPLIEHQIQIPELFGAVALLATEKVGEEAARNLLVDFGSSFKYTKRKSV